MENHKHRVAAATYLVFFLPRLLAEREDEFLKYHEKQAVGLLVVALALQGAMTIILYWLPNYSLAQLLVWTIRFFLVYEVIVGMNGALSNKKEPLPYFGKYAERL